MRVAQRVHDVQLTVAHAEILGVVLLQRVPLGLLEHAASAIASSRAPRRTPEAQR